MKIRVVSSTIATALLLVAALADARAAEMAATSAAPNEPVNFMSWVGEEHNQGLRYVLQHLDGVPDRAGTEAAVGRLVEQFYVGLRGSHVAPAVPELPESSAEFDAYAWIDVHCSAPELRPLLVRLVHLVEIDQPLEQFDRGLDELERDAVVTVFGQNLRALFACTAVARASMRFWTPKDLGGFGGASYLHEYAAAGCSATTRGKWWKIVVADVLGACAGGVSGAILSSSYAGIWWFYNN